GVIQEQAQVRRRLMDLTRRLDLEFGEPSEAQVPVDRRAWLRQPILKVPRHEFSIVLLGLRAQRPTLHPMMLEVVVDDLLKRGAERLLFFSFSYRCGFGVFALLDRIDTRQHQRLSFRTLGSCVVST